MNINRLVKRLNTLEQKAKFQRVVLILSLIIILLMAIFRPLEILQEKNFLMAYILLVTAIAIKLIPNLKGKYHFINQHEIFSNTVYVEKLRIKMTFDTKRLVLFLLVLFMALNFALLGLYVKGSIFNYPFTPENRIYVHLATVLLFIVGYFVHRKSILRNRSEITDLIDQLECTN